MADLTQAIQAATEALMTWEPESDENRPMQAAKVMVTAAAPHLHADLQRRLEQAERNADRLVSERRQLYDRLDSFEQAIVDALGELRWDKVSAALVTLHASGIDLAAPATPEVGDG